MAAPLPDLGPDWVIDEPAAPATPEPPPRTPVSILQSLARGGAQGASFGFADELAGAYDALSDLGAPESFGERYRKGRDESRAAFKTAEEDHPTASLIGNIGGGVATAALGGLGAGALRGGAAAAKALAPTGARSLAQLLQAAKLGAAGGAGAGLASGLGASQADITKGEVGRAALDTGLGGLVGGALGGALPVAGEGIALGARRVGQYAAKKAPEFYRGAVGLIQQHEAKLGAPKAAELGEWIGDEDIVPWRPWGVGKEEIVKRLQDKAREESVNDLLGQAKEPFNPVPFLRESAGFLQDPTTSETALREMNPTVSKLMGDYMRTVGRMRTKYVPADAADELGTIASSLGKTATEGTPEQLGAARTLQQLIAGQKGLPAGESSALARSAAPPSGLARRAGLERMAPAIEGEIVDPNAPSALALIPKEAQPGPAMRQVRENVPRSLVDLNRLKTDWQKGTKYAANAPEQFQNDAKQKMAALLREAIDEQAIPQLGPVDAARYLKAKRDWGMAQEALKGAEHAMARESGNNPVTAGGLLMSAGQLATGAMDPASIAKAMGSAVSYKALKERGSSVAAPILRAIGENLSPTTTALQRRLGGLATAGARAPVTTRTLEDLLTPRPGELASQQTEGLGAGPVNVSLLEQWLRSRQGAPSGQ